MERELSDYPEDFRNVIIPVLRKHGYDEISFMKRTFSYIFEFSKEEIRLNFNYDTRDNAFYFHVVFGKDTLFPNDKDEENIVPVQRLFLEQGFCTRYEDLQPNVEGYMTALKNVSNCLDSFLDNNTDFWNSLR